jgi:hypothetical protein
MAQLTPPSTTKYQSGQPAFGTDVLGDLNTIYTDYNGGITDYNIAAGAAIATSKLAAITTAGKVSGAALTLLPNIPSGAGLIPVANIDTGTTANKIVILDGSAKLPAVDGSELTGFTAAQTPTDIRIKGWASVTYSGGTPTLNDSFNVSGITDTGTGQLTVTWDTDFASANYAVVATVLNSDQSPNIWAKIGAIAAGSCRIDCNGSDGNLYDPEGIYVIAIGDQ